MYWRVTVFGDAGLRTAIVRTRAAFTDMPVSDMEQVAADHGKQCDDDYRPWPGVWQ